MCVFVVSVHLACVHVFVYIFVYIIVGLTFKPMFCKGYVLACEIFLYIAYITLLVAVMLFCI